jgi:hypothetical protein
LTEALVRKLLIAAGFTASALALAACDPYGYPSPGPYPDPSIPGGGYGGEPGAPVRVLGCPMPGVESNCLSVRATSGQVFDVSGAYQRPDPRSPFAVEVSGRVSDAVGYCQAGTILEDVRIQPTNLRCVDGAVQGYRTPAY